ncbi:4-(cytidine 5'-diphospho)-2-C-methyl-D-erythritol kinase [Brumimicrobium salinarum]|uniref:4-diphosphocytidyl-2-C-methyl-D-erythritol kinase n=1 Tax=Brumimicrobium salinarum TaxID=2058658 RepID=A0A2I0R334_9FLAO|nr:4-(cytidine 5'-diphospho)-2-C-methyl-D-erythritol kinase [Brumimicrobium salinarum]PKR80983.1 4-(cytidine 5'-diphospho)-2-C-methyl-D-erythritol kinase [Brumimicrobium salinarum]
MISFPNCKINIGLNILGKRKDGYHEINTLMYPVPIHDVLEIIPHKNFSFSSSGLPIPGKYEDNLVIKAYELLKPEFNLAPVHIHLYKNIPMGGGLGGGSSNGAFALKMLNEIFKLNLNERQLQDRALKLGSDCPFFISNCPQLAKGRGEVLEKHPLNLKGSFLMLVNNGIHINTKEAYARVEPKTPNYFIENLVMEPFESWKSDVYNDFEVPTLDKYPDLQTIKDKLYANGAFYAAMTGSGSTMYGLFAEKPSSQLFNFPNGFVQVVAL